MARMAFKAGDEYMLKLSKLGEGKGEISKKALYAGAGVLADEIKKNLSKILSEEATGDLMSSFGITPITLDKEQNYNAKIGFDGYDSKGIANQLKARVLESGTADGKKKKKPFVRPAVLAKKKEAIEVMDNVIKEELEKLNL